MWALDSSSGVLPGPFDGRESVVRSIGAVKAINVFLRKSFGTTMI
jgi:hypothetical protein